MELLDLVKDFWGYVALPAIGIAGAAWNKLLGRVKALETEKVTDRADHAEVIHALKLEMQKRVTYREAREMIEASVGKVDESIKELRDDIRAYMKDK